MFLYKIQSGDFTSQFMRHVDNQTFKADEEAELFQVEYDSSDEEGRQKEHHEAMNRKKRQNLALNDETVYMNKGIKFIKNLFFKDTFDP